MLEILARLFFSQHAVNPLVKVSGEHSKSYPSLMTPLGLLSLSPPTNNATAGNREAGAKGLQKEPA